MTQFHVKVRSTGETVSVEASDHEEVVYEAAAMGISWFDIERVEVVQ